MFPIDSDTIARITSATIIGKSSNSINSVAIDSRTCPPSVDVLFIAIEGNRNNGHSFIHELYNRGVRHFLIDNSYSPELSLNNACFFQVKSTIQALQALGKHHRLQFKKTIIGITGSNGKTIVKEWLYSILSPEYNICKSPKSFNSQIGVPLSLFELNRDADFGIIEAGISKIGEMGKLADLITPDIGVITNIGEAHQQNFNSFEEKIHEKLLLFASAKTIVFCADAKQINNIINKEYSHKNLVSWSTTKDKARYYVKTEIKASSTSIAISDSESIQTYSIPFTDNASIENSITVIVTIMCILPLNSKLLQRTQSLPTVEMRLKYMEGINNCTLINDCYNSDFESIKASIQSLSSYNSPLPKTVILSDFEHSPTLKQLAIEEILDQLERVKIESLYLVGDFPNTSERKFKISKYESTETILNDLKSTTFKNKCILIKGSRKFCFEKIVKKLEKRTHQTILEVNLTAISNNLNYFRSKLHNRTKVMAMVKGFSYGSGDFEIAQHLKEHKVDYLAVAFVDEAIVLRQQGINLPIAVLNPEVENYSTILDYNLEPEIYSIGSLQRLIEETQFYSHSTPIGIHIKLDTGMHRLGIEKEDLPTFLNILTNNRKIKVLSIFSHLCGADSQEFDDFTHIQVARFKEMLELIKEQIQYDVLTHILNSAGTERFPEYQFDMVRLGIGLYGISSETENQTEHISTLRTIISQIREVKAGDTVGYNRKGTVSKNTKIGILPIGYADGYDRRFSNGIGQVLIHGKLAPIIGNICMDACMVNLNGIHVQEGDEAVIFSPEHTISTLANQIGTIPYEILTNVSKRVKRIYYKE